MAAAATAAAASLQAAALATTTRLSSSPYRPRRHTSTVRTFPCDRASVLSSFSPSSSSSSSRHFRRASSIPHRRRASVQTPPPLEQNPSSPASSPLSLPACPRALMEELIEFLKDDLPHLFDDRGINKERYEKNVDFRDPITKYSSVDGYLFNIQMLRYLFTPKFELHSVKQSGPCEITTRWTMTMRFALLPWRPELIFTGTSVMGINPASGKFLSHVDYWDSIENNEYFSLEGLMDLLKQLRYYKTPDLQTPKYRVLKRTSIYEVREYEPFIVVEAQGDRLTGSKGFKYVTDYIFGNNSNGQRIPMTTPVITRTSNEPESDVQIQIVLPVDSKMPNLPSPVVDLVKLNEVGGGVMAAIKFSGASTEEEVLEKERELRLALERDGEQAMQGFMLARYNDPGRTWSFIRRNEVLIPLEGFRMD